MNLTDWLPDHLRGWSNHARAKDIQVRQDEQEPLWVRAHPALLSQLLDNLLENACKYSRPGTPVEIQTRRDSGFAVVIVVDHGYGLSAEEKAGYFNPSTVPRKPAAAARRVWALAWRSPSGSSQPSGVRSVSTASLVSEPASKSVFSRRHAIVYLVVGLSTHFTKRSEAFSAACGR